MTPKERLKYIKNLIATANLKEAINRLLAYAETENCSEYNELISLSGKYHDLETMDLADRISYDNYQRDASKLRRSLIAFVEIFESRLPGEEKETDSKDISAIYKTSIARIRVVEVLIETANGLTIKEISDKSGLRSRKYLIAALDELIAANIVERYQEKGKSLNKIVEEKRKMVEKWL